MNHDEYGDNYQAHLLEQYKLYVEMADRISQRRDQSNRFYAGLVSAIVALLVVMGRIGVSESIWVIALLFAGLLGAALSVIWYINPRFLSCTQFSQIPCHQRDGVAVALRRLQRGMGRPAPSTRAGKVFPTYENRTLRASADIGALCRDRGLLNLFHDQ